LAAALALFGEHGYDETTVEAITAAAGVAVGAFYQHFVSKRQLLLVLMDQLLHQAALLPATATEMGGQDRLTMIAQLVRQGLVIDWSYAGALRAWREAAVRDHELRGLNERIERWTAAQLAGLLHLLASDPAARRDVDVATFAWLLSLLFWRLAETPLDDAEAIVTVLTQMIARMLFP
jgi:AcrR family transcriptional regulator